ncbi:MAG: 4-phosphopantetheinyl transferase [Rhodospirillales bacterium]|nr:4-phosphopantetheinyl transferase [Rhodospirillales bacterium]
MLVRSSSAQESSPAPAAECWSIAVDGIDETGVRDLSGLLDDAERSRAARFHRAEDRRRHVVARCAARVILAAALRRRPSEIRFVTGDAGKPALVDGALEFNLSHSGAFVVIAVSEFGPIGIDVEEIRPMPDRDAIAQRYFHPGEVADLRSLTEPEATLAFFRCWTRKEAVSKALGLGLGLALDDYCVSCLPWEGARLREMAGDAAPGRWSIRDLTLGMGYAAAVAAPVASLELIHRRLDHRALLGGMAAKDFPMHLEF